MKVIINPYHKSVTIDGVEVVQKFINFPDALNHLASISCDYDRDSQTITDVQDVHRYVSHAIEKQYYYKHLPEFVDWFYAEQQAQLDNAISVEQQIVAANTAAQNAATSAEKAKLEAEEAKKTNQNTQQAVDNAVAKLTQAGSTLPVKSDGTDIARTLGERFADVVNVKDFGAVGDGQTDDTEAFEAALKTGRSVFVPVGDYNLNAQVQGNFITMPDVSFIGFSPVCSPIVKMACPHILTMFISLSGSDDIDTPKTKGLSEDKAFRTFDGAFAFFKKYYQVTSPETQLNLHFGAGDFGDLTIRQVTPDCQLRLFGCDEEHSTRFHHININYAGFLHMQNLAFSCIDMRSCVVWAAGKIGIISDARHTSYAISSGWPGTDFILYSTAVLSFLEPVTYSKAPFFCNAELRAGATIQGASNVSAPFKYYASDNQLVNCATSVYEQMTWATNFYVASDSSSIQTLIGKDLSYNKATGGPTVVATNNYRISADGFAICWGVGMFSDSTTAKVDLPIKFISKTAYVVIISPRTATPMRGPSNSEKTEESFIVTASTATSAGFDWVVLGQSNGV